MHLAEGASPEQTVLIDAFAGVGGNVIAFARSGRWKEIHAIEIDEAVLRCAQHNASIYEVDHLITWHHGNSFDVLCNELAHVKSQCVIFASPPWGGKAIRPVMHAYLNI